MTNFLVVNDGVDFGTLTGRLASAVQGEVGKTLIIDIQDQAGNDYPITGATGISASMTTPAGVTTAVTGTITVASGGLSWELSSGDVGTAGEFSLVVQFTFNGDICKTHPVRWIVIEDPAATAVQNQAVVGVSSRLEWTVHIPGSLSENVNARWKVPSGCKVSHISAVTSNNSDATMTFGISSDTDSILASTAIGDSNTPAAFTSADWAITNPTGELITGDIAVLTVDYDGASGTAAADLTVIITTTSQVISVAGAVEDISDLTAVGYAADDFIQWNGSVFINVTPATVLSEIAAAAAVHTHSYQPLDAGLTDLAGLAVTDGNIPVGDGANWVAESGATARASLGAAALGANTFTGEQTLADNLLTRPVLKDYGETINAIGSIGGGSQDIDLTLGNVVTGTVDTSTTTFTFSNPSASGTACSFTLFLTNGGSQTVNWPASVDWAGGAAPTLTAAGVDILTFATLDGGTTWFGFAAGLDMS